MFPVETARSIAAQLILGLSYLHSRGVCHGDLHLHNILIYGLDIDHLTPDEIYSRYAYNSATVKRVDGAAPGPHAPPYAVYSIPIKTPADKLVDPTVKISNYGTLFALFGDSTTATFAADIWTLGVNLYEALGERPLFETFTWDRNDILADVISTLGQPPKRWWDAWL